MTHNTQTVTPMGASLGARLDGQMRHNGPSSSSAPEAGSSSSSPLSGFDLLELPRDCLVRVMLALSPPDVCRMARVCRTLRALVDSNDVWASRISDDPAIDPPSLSRKDLFFRLRAGMLRKDLSQPYWLEPETGEGCFVISARHLWIVWGDDQRYWRWEQQPESWFAETACLLMVCWFEVVGNFERMFLPGSYIVSVRMKLSDNLLGWAGAPVKFTLSTSNGQHVESQRYFFGKRSEGVSKLAPLRQLRSCSWTELDIGEFVVDREMHVKVQFKMMEIQGGHWKTGLLLDSVKVQPSSAIS